jgi:hypothetical protein
MFFFHLNPYYNFKLNWYSGGWNQLSPLGTVASNRPIVPAPCDYGNGEFGGMIGKGNWSTWRKPATVPLCPPQIPYAVWIQTQATAVGSQRVTAWATARPSIHTKSSLTKIYYNMNILSSLLKTFGVDKF